MKFKILLVFLLLFTQFGCNRLIETNMLTGKEGQRIPKFNILLSDGTTYFNTNEIKSGKSTTIFYFNSTCPYCQIQIEEIIKSMESLKSVDFLMITSEEYSYMRKFKYEHQLDKYPNIIVGTDTGNFFPNYYKITGYPFFAFYDKHIKLRSVWDGKMEIKSLIRSAN